MARGGIQRSVIYFSFLMFFFYQIATSNDSMVCQGTAKSKKGRDVMVKAVQMHGVIGTDFLLFFLM